jgi:succinoglycan biosynthesis transport protein ExoP
MEGMPSRPLTIAIGIATAGRRDVVSQTVSLLRNQTRLPDIVVVCPLVSDKINDGDFLDLPFDVLVTSGPVGLCAQRNAILATVSYCDVIIFFDDDFLAEPHYLERLESLFQSEPDVCAATGLLLADDVTGPGLNIEQGLGILRDNVRDGSAILKDVPGLYGCNMAYRIDYVRDNQLQFDENLPLYGWQEDIDFSLQMKPFGRLVKSDLLMGVHLGVKAGRTSGVRLGYSQIANPVYLSKKGTMPWPHARKLISKNVAANLARSIYPEPWVDRHGRLKGNLLALMDLLLGKASPARILQL